MDHLNFVLDNWFLLDYALINKDRIKYVIVAFFQNDEEENENENMNNLVQNVERIDDGFSLLLN